MESTINKLIVKLPTKYIKNISGILKRAEIANLSSVSPTDLVQVVGEVIAIPKRITTEKRGYEGFSTKDIRVGDTVFFRYDLVHDFKALDAETNIYRNEFEHDAKSYWLCDIQKVFAVIRNGNIIMVNGYVMVEDFDERKIYVSHYIKRKLETRKSKVLYIGSPKENEEPFPAKQHDTVIFDPTKAAKYQINDKKFRIIQQKFVLGKIILSN